VRARLACIASDPGEWEAVVRPRLEGWRDPNEAYLILQTVVGAWPLDAARLEPYLEKALREAKVHTTWIDQDHEWEGGAKAYATGLLADAELARYARRLAERGDRASLAMTLLKLTSPGVPDLYQGDELPFLALVDPDNRRPVDWDLRRRLLRSEPPPKLELIREALQLRARRPAAFAGSYEPLDAVGDVCAFTRGGEVLVAVALRGDLARFRSPPGGPWRALVRTSGLLLAERA
jgi:(1->4)-alpha-D-glucan 1-alpha-D-glucosylmutase